MRGLEGREVTRNGELVPDPVFEGPAGEAAIGVVAGGLGSRSLLKAVKGLAAYRVANIEAMAPSSLSKCEALILPERRVPAALSKQQCWVIWDWVSAGGRLILTHDAVGYREHPVLFPWVCYGGTAHVRGAPVEVVWAPDGEKPVGTIRPSYPEHILLQPCLRAQTTVIAVDAQTGKPTVSGAALDTGRVLACGLALGAGPGGADKPLNPGELALLKAMLAWLMA